MTEAWPVAVTQIDKRAKLGTIVHLGAGEGSELSAYLATRAQRIVLAEPDPDLLPVLERAAGADERVLIRPVALAQTDGQAPLDQYNFPALSSLHTPTGVQALFPGLHRRARPMVETQCLDSLLRQIDMPKGREHILVIETPGGEGQVIGDLLAGNWATQFSHIVLRAALEPAYEGAVAFPDLVSRLEAGGYRVSAQSTADPDFPEVHLRFEPLVLENRELQQELARVREQASEAEKARAALESDVAELTSARDTAATATAEREARIATLKEELATRKVERDDHKARASEAEKARAALKDDVATCKAEREACREELEKEQRRHKTEMAETQARTAELETELERTHARLRAVEDELVAAGAQMEIVRELMHLPGPGAEGER